MRDAVAAKIASIAADRTHGASYLAARAAETLLDAGPDIVDAARAIASAQPAMAALRSLAERVLSEPARAEAICREALERGMAAQQAAAERASHLILNGGTVLTHSRSATVELAFDFARRTGKSFRVIATESLPLGEGAELARSLEEQSIPVTRIADAAVYRYMAEADVVLVGADTVTPAHVINKIGTSLVALAAREHQIAMYVVCTTDKRVSVETPVESEYFESTPRTLMSGIVTEEGML
jgi:translation initiation factor 2B subunit (eIF-2B alpha/beta/delta family)